MHLEIELNPFSVAFCHPILTDWHFTRARKNLKPHIGDVDAAAVPCGLGHAIGNKVSDFLHTCHYFHYLNLIIFAIFDSEQYEFMYQKYYYSITCKKFTWYDAKIYLATFEMSKCTTQQIKFHHVTVNYQSF